MTVDTGGPIRGFIGRWLMRVQAVQGTLQLVGIAVTAGSTLTTALVAVGHASLAPWILGASPFLGLAYAWVYVECGVYNRKNRENADRGGNWAGPTAYINNFIATVGVYYAVNKEMPDEDEYEEMAEAVKVAYDELRDGVDFDG